MSLVGEHACGITTDHTIVCWGQTTMAPQTPAVQVTASLDHPCAVQTDGTLVCWDRGTTVAALHPPVGSFTEVVGGVHFNCALSSTGEARCWGLDFHGETSPPSERFTQLTAAGFHACGVTPAGEIRCWGNDDWGQASPP